MIHIRRSHPEKDTPQLEKLFQLTRQQTFATRPPTSFQIGDYAKSTAEEDVWVAEENDQILGFVSIFPANNFLHNLFIHPDAQRIGLGTKLLQMAETNLDHPMTLKIAMDNLTACSFYEKYGWARVSVHEDGKEPYVLYRKD